MDFVVTLAKYCAIYLIFAYIAVFIINRVERAIKARRAG